MAITAGRSLAIDGDLAYNGWQFPPTMNVKVTGTMEPSTDRRTVKYVRYVVTVSGVFVGEDWISGSANDQYTDDLLNDLRMRLSKPSRELIFYDRGFGQLVINKDKADTPIAINIQHQSGQDVPNTSQVVDAQWGPMPRILQWQPIAGHGACELTWECEVVIPECADAKFKDRISDFNYSVSWSINQERMTTRTITGSIEIPATRLIHGLGTVGRKQAADVFRDAVSVPTLDRFLRTDSYQLSPDRRTLSFSIVDTEIPSDSVFPVGVVNMQARYRLASDLARAFTKWDFGISGSVTIAPGVPRVFLWWAIREVVLDRLKRLQAREFRDDKGRVRKGESKVGLYRVSMELEIDLFGRSSSFSFNYVSHQDLKSLLKGSGFLVPIRNHKWSDWRKSLAHVTHERGYAQLAFNPTADIIVDLCTPLASAGSPDKGNREDTKALSRTESPFIETPKTPDPVVSWLHYKVTYRWKIDKNVASYAPLHKDSQASKNARADLEQKSQSNYDSLVDQDPPKSTGKTQVWARGTDRVEVHVTVDAARIGHKIPEPKFTAFGGAKALLRSENATHSTAGSGDGTIYLMKWHGVYILEQMPTKKMNWDNIDSEALPEHIASLSRE